MSHLDDIATALQSASVGTIGTDLFKGRMPETPVACVSLQTYPGRAPQYVEEQSTPGYERPAFQVMVRNSDHATAETKARAAFDALTLIRNVTVGGTRFLAIRPYQSPFELSRDENDRVLYAFNFEAMIARY